MPSNSALKENLYGILSNSFSNPRNIEEFKNAVTAYLDRNLTKLSTSGPVNKIYFIDSDKSVVYKTTGITPELVNRVIPESTHIKSHWKNIASPFNVASAMIISYAKNNNDEDLATFALMYLTLSMYPSILHKYFPYEINSQIMDYTINNLSNKFKVKQQGTIWNALFDTAKVCDKTYSNNIKRATDKDITDYVEAIKTRLNALIKKIKNEFTKNYNDKNIMTVEQDNEDKDNYSKAESNSYIVDRVANSVALKLAINGPDFRLVDIASKTNDISINDLRTVVTQLVTDKTNSKDIVKIISSILVLFLNETKSSINEVKSNKFIIESLKIYKKSNTGDKNVIIIKKLLDKWLSAYSERYKVSNRAGTLNSFRRALYTFFVFTIQLNISIQ